MIEVVRETHETPADVAKILRVAGGLNRFGGPNYRCVWGGSRMDWIGGKWEDRNNSGTLIREVIEVRYVPKYGDDRWHFEVWRSPESYGSPEDWELETLETDDGQFIPALGPYPYRGDYENSYTLEDAKRNFVQLTPEIARTWALLLALTRNRKVSLEEFKSRAVAAHDREYDSFADAVMNDSKRAFDGSPFVSVL